jgi:hypothetical protein
LTLILKQFIEFRGAFYGKIIELTWDNQFCVAVMEGEPKVIANEEEGAPRQP